MYGPIETNRQGDAVMSVRDPRVVIVCIVVAAAALAAFFFFIQMGKLQ